MKYNNVPFVKTLGGCRQQGVICGQGMLSGVEEVVIDPEGRRGTRRWGEGSLALWPMIKPDGHAAGVKREELGVMTSGMWRSLFLFD